MKLEYLPDGSDDCPLVRVYDFVPAEIARLFAAVSVLACSEEQSIAIHEMAGVEPVSDCGLLLRSGSRDRGLTRVSGPATFECILTPKTWDNVAGLIEPFLDGENGYQWLVTSGDARFLLSADGQW